MDYVVVLLELEPVLENADYDEALLYARLPDRLEFDHLEGHLEQEFVLGSESHVASSKDLHYKYSRKCLLHPLSPGLVRLGRPLRLGLLLHIGVRCALLLLFLLLFFLLLLLLELLLLLLELAVVVLLQEDVDDGPEDEVVVVDVDHVAFLLRRVAGPANGFHKGEDILIDGPQWKVFQ